MHITQLKCRPHFGVQTQIYHNSDGVLYWITSWSSTLRIKSRRFLTHSCEIYYFFNITHSPCVLFMSLHQESCVYPIKLWSQWCDLYTVLELKFDVESFISCFIHSWAPTHPPGPSEHIKFRIFVTALPRSSKSWFYGKLRLKVPGIVTNSM